MDEPIDFYRHHLGDAEAQAFAEALGSLFLTTGPRTRTFEERLGARLGHAHAAGVSSCSMGLLLALEALGVGPGDEVITTPLTFVATANAVLHAGAMPVFVDVEADTGNLDAARIEAAITPRTRAILPVHLYGQMADMRAIAKVAADHGLGVVEDAAHALEASRDGVVPGALSDAAVFSFYATKNLTSGEGGAVVSRSAEVADEVRRRRSHGISREAYDRHGGPYAHWDMETLGHKANLPDLLAAVLLPQLDGIDDRLARREALAQVYDRSLGGLAEVDRPRVRGDSVHARHLYTVWVPASKRDQALAHLGRRRVGAAVNYRPVHRLTYYRERFGFEEGSFPNAEEIGSRTLSLPFYPTMDPRLVERVVTALEEGLR